MSPAQVVSPVIMLTVGLTGLFTGALIKYVANILLTTEGLFSRPIIDSPRAHKPGLQEAIPFFSLFLLSNKCTPFQRQSILEYTLVEVLTATAFLTITWQYGISSFSLGMMTLVAFLIAICITDFKAKIIPHELTYPAIIVGTIFSAQIRSDLFGALAGIGVSYLLFDFLAFYGLHIYIWLNKPVLALSQELASKPEQTIMLASIKTRRAQIDSPTSLAPDELSPSELTTANKPLWLSSESQQIARPLNKDIYRARLFSKGVPVEELEIIGGGDAVLSALISAWLGWRKLVLALVISFLLGTILGAIYLLVELWKERLIKTIIPSVAIAALGSCLVTTILLALIAASIRQPITNMPYLSALPLAIVIGSLLGIIISGSRVSKPFPFGPALALGAIIAIFQREPTA